MRDIGPSPREETNLTEVSQFPVSFSNRRNRSVTNLHSGPRKCGRGYGPTWICRLRFTAHEPGLRAKESGCHVVPRKGTSQPRTGCIFSTATPHPRPSLMTTTKPCVSSLPTTQPIRQTAGRHPSPSPADMRLTGPPFSRPSRAARPPHRTHQPMPQSPLPPTSPQVPACPRRARRAPVVRGSAVRGARPQP